MNGWVTEPVETLWGRKNPLPLSNLNKSLKVMKPKSGGTFEFIGFLDMNTARKVLEYPHLDSLIRGLFTEKKLSRLC